MICETAGSVCCTTLCTVCSLLLEYGFTIEKKASPLAVQLWSHEAWFSYCFSSHLSYFGRRRPCEKKIYSRLTNHDAWWAGKSTSYSCVVTDRQLRNCLLCSGRFSSTQCLLTKNIDAVNSELSRNVDHKHDNCVCLLPASE